jgi:hypothetical protein
VSAGDDLISVLWTQSPLEGEIAKGLLETEGIPVELREGAQGPYPTGPVELFVPRSFEARAREVLSQRPG